MDLDHALLVLTGLVILLGGCIPSIPGSPALAPGASTPPMGSPVSPTVATTPYSQASPGALSPKVGNQLPVSAPNVEITQPGEWPQARATPPRPTPLATAARTRNVQSTSDLLYISQDRLMRWDHVTHYASPLAEGVVAYATIPGLQFSTQPGVTNRPLIALLRPRRITANGIDTFDVDLLDLQSMQTVPLLHEVSRPFSMALSPDGQWLAYTQSEHQGPIWLTRTGNPQTTLELGDCTRQQPGQCEDLAWSSDSHFLLWSEAQGLWMSDLHEKAARLVHPAQFQVTDPKGQTVAIDVYFRSPRWSPTGRFALVEVKPTDSEVGWQAILDTRSGKMSQLPDSFKFTEHEACALWLLDGSLLLAHASDPEQQTPPLVSTWRVLPTNPDLLVARRTLELYSDDFPFNSASSKAVPVHYLAWLNQPDADHITLGVTLINSQAAPVLFMLSLGNGRLQTLYPIPVEATEVLWAPDASGVLVTGSRGEVFFISKDRTLDLSPTLGIDPHAFSWLQPAPRK